MNYPYYIVVNGDGTLFDIPKKNIKTGCQIRFIDRFCETLLPYGLTVFRSVDVARGLLMTAGYTMEQVSSLHFLRSIGTCDRCGAPLFPSMGDEEEGYKSQCFYCDEDFYDFEQVSPLDKCFDQLPEKGPLTKQNYAVGDKVFLGPDGEVITIFKVYDDIFYALKNRFTINTNYMGQDWAILKSPDGLYAAVAKGNTAYAAADVQPKDKAKSPAVISLSAVCPKCGSTKWLEKGDKDGAFVCASCGEHIFPEEMSLKNEAAPQENATDKLSFEALINALPGFGPDTKWWTDGVSIYMGADKTSKDLPPKWMLYAYLMGAANMVEAITGHAMVVGSLGSEDGSWRGDITPREDYDGTALSQLEHGSSAE